MTLTHKIKEYIGQMVIYEVDGMKVHCKVTNIKSAYGHWLYRLEPIAGSGHKWTSKEPEVLR